MHIQYVELWIPFIIQLNGKTLAKIVFFTMVAMETKVSFGSELDRSLASSTQFQVHCLCSIVEKLKQKINSTNFLSISKEKHVESL